MKLTIFAATGGIGRQILEQAVDAGHDVTAVIRNPQKLPGELSSQVRVVTADLAAPDQATLESAVEGAGAVLSGLGPRSNAEAGIATRGTQAITAAMKATGVRRIVVVSAAPIGTVPSPARPDPPKHDPGDSRWLAACFERGAVTSCFVATEEFRVIRLHTRYRRDLTDERIRESSARRSCWNRPRSSCRRWSPTCTG